MRDCIGVWKSFLLACVEQSGKMYRSRSCYLSVVYLDILVALFMYQFQLNDALLTYDKHCHLATCLYIECIKKRKPNAPPWDLVLVLHRSVNHSNSYSCSTAVSAKQTTLLSTSMFLHVMEGRSKKKLLLALSFREKPKLSKLFFWQIDNRKISRVTESQPSTFCYVFYFYVDQYLQFEEL